MKKTIKNLSLFFIFILSLNAQDINLSQYKDNPKIPLTVSGEIDKSDLSAKDKYEWLVFVYMNGVNDLGMLNLTVNDINEMEMVGSTEKVAVVVEHNMIQENDDRTLNFSNGSVTYFIEKDKKNSESIISRVIDETPDSDMGNYMHFAISAQKAINRFHPSKVMIILWNHGNGYFGISIDDISKNTINLPQLKMALSAISKTYGKKIDIFAMDACLMQMAEVVTEIHDTARYILASEENMPGDSFPYHKLLETLNNTSSVQQAAISIASTHKEVYEKTIPSPFSNYYDKNVTISVVDTSKYSEFLSSLNRWVERAIDSKDFDVITSTNITENIFFFRSGDQRETAGSIYSTESENVMTRSADLMDYLYKAKSKMKDSELISLTDSLIASIKDMVIFDTAVDSLNSSGLSYKKRTHGLAIYMPLIKYDSRRYEAIQFSKVSLWDEFIKKMLSRENISDRADISSLNNIPVVKNSDTQKESTSIAKSPDINNTEPIKDIKSQNAANTGSLNQDINSQNKELNKTEIKKDETATKVENSEKNKNADKKIIEKTGIVEENAQIKKEVSSTLSKDLISTTKKITNLIAEKTKSAYEALFPDKEKTAEYQKQLEKFDLKISTELDFTYCEMLLKNDELQKEFSKINKNKTEKLIAYSNELMELKNLVSANYNQDNLNSLSKALETALDKSRLICELKICVPPEKLTQWMSNYSFDNSKISNTEIAIRKWDKIFNSNETNLVWDQANSVKFTSTTWSNMSIKERNAVLDKYVKKELSWGTTSSLIINMSDNRSMQIKKYYELSDSVEQVLNNMSANKFLSDEQLSAIRGKPLYEQMEILSNLFDRAGLYEGSETLKKSPDSEKLLSSVNLINANRSSFTNEVIDQKTRAAISSYVTNGAKAELSKSETGKKLYSDLSTKPVISVEYLEGQEAINDGKNIKIDAKIVEQFLRVKGYTNADLIKNTEVKSELLTYISPLIAREVANINISKNMGTGYSPQVREKYATALLYQAKYSEERENDPKFKAIFNKFNGISDYADKVIIIERNYKQADNKNDFIQSAGLKYYSNMMSSNSAKNEIKLAIIKELERRQSLNKKEQNNIDRYAIFKGEEAYKLNPFELTNYIKDIDTETLLKLQKEINSSSNFDSNLRNIISSVK